MLISRKRRTLAQNRAMSMLDFDNYHRMGPLRMLCYITFRSDIFGLCICVKTCAVTVDVPGRVSSTRKARHGVVLVRSVISMYEDI